MFREASYTDQRNLLFQNVLKNINLVVVIYMKLRERKIYCLGKMYCLLFICIHDFDVEDKKLTLILEVFMAPSIIGLMVPGD